MKHSLTILSTLVLLSIAHAQEPVAELLTVRRGTIYPTNVAAEVSDVAKAVAQAEAAAAQADAVETAAAMVSNAVAGVTEIVNSLEGIGYIRGHIMSFGAGVEDVNTNAQATIVKIASAGTTSTNSLWNIWTYFTEDPGALPIIRFTDSLGRTNSWHEANAVGDPALDTILVGSTEFEAYKNTVSMPAEYESAFFRTFVEVSGVGTNIVYLPVRNGISVNGITPLTATFVDGTTTYSFVGGVRVQ